MDWGSLMSLSILGSVCSSVAIVLAVYMGIRYHQFLPKKAVYDSLEQLSHQLEEKREEYDDVRDSLSLAKNTIQEAEERQEYLARTRDEVQQLESKRREFQETQGQIESLQGQRRDLQASLDELTARQVETESRLQKQLAQILSPEEFERRKDEVQGLQRRHRELTESVANSESRSKELAARVSELNARVSDMTTDVEVLTVNKAGLVEAVSGLQARREQLEAQIEDLYHMRDAVAGPEGVAEASKVTELLWTPAVHKADLREGPGGITDELQAGSRIPLPRTCDQGLPHLPEVLGGRAAHGACRHLGNRQERIAQTLRGGHGHALSHRSGAARVGQSSRHSGLLQPPRAALSPDRASPGALADGPGARRLARMGR